MGDKKKIRVVLITLFGLDFGARSISAFLKKNGYPVSLIFFNKLRYSVGLLSNDCFNASVTTSDVCGKRDLDLLIALLKKLDAKIIGVSLTSTSFQTAKIITLEIKKHIDVTVVWGGVHAIVSPEECIRYADIVCVGEGEIPMLELAERLKNNAPLRGLGNLWIKNADGIEKNQLNPLIEDLDTLPFPDFVDRDNKFLIDSGRIAREYEIVSAYERSVYPIMTSRGCVYACSFCSNSILSRRYGGKGNYLRRRSVANVVDELKYAAANRQFSGVRFWDDIFTCDAAWINDFCDQYLRAIGKPFSCYTHPLRTDTKILTRLRNAGLHLASIGIQSGSEETARHLFSRVQSNRDLLAFARFSDNLGVTTRYDVICDNPYETDQDEERTVELLMQLPYPFQIQLYSLCWFPETPLSQKALVDKTITASDCEQYAAKALNNFHMHISLSRNQRAFFWNCIKGMAINRLFPVFLIKACMRNWFFKKHPRALFLAGKWYLSLFSKHSLKVKKRGVVWERKTPFNVAHDVLQLDKHTVNSDAVTGAAKWLFQRPAADYSFIPLSGSAGLKEVSLKIRNHSMTETSFDFIVMLVAFADFFQKSPEKTMWRMKIHTGEINESHVRVKLQYPELTCRVGENKGAAILLERGIPCLISGKLYSLVVQSGAKPHTRIDTLLFKA